MQLRVFKKSFLFILLVGLENLKATDARKIEVMYYLTKKSLCICFAKCSAISSFVFPLSKYSPVPSKSSLALNLIVVFFQNIVLLK